MSFLKKRFPAWCNGFCLVIMVMLGLYLFDDNPGLFGALSTFFNSANDAVQTADMPQVELSWQLGLLGGIFFGGFCGSLIQGSFKLVFALEDAKGFTGKTIFTVLWSIFAGFLVMLGAVAAGEILFGQLAAAMELSAGAWFFIVTALIAAGITALFVERRGGVEKSSGKGE